VWDLAREHRVLGEPEHLRALDLGVPVRALDQPHRDARARLAGERGDPVDHRARALLVRLHGEAEAFPAGERRVVTQSREHLERQLQPVGLLGVDGEADAARPGDRREPGDDRHELVERALRCVIS
jgi:hypothetical protein